MYLEILTLALLQNEPMHAYSIRSNINKIFVDYRKINNNSLYPLMKKMESSGHIIKHIEIQTDKPNKAIYTVTELGKIHFIELIKSFSEKDAYNEMEFYTRVMMFDLLDKDTIKSILDLRKEILRKRQEFYSKNSSYNLFSTISSTAMFEHLSKNLKNEIEFINTLEDKYLK